MELKQGYTDTNHKKSNKRNKKVPHMKMKDPLKHVVEDNYKGKA